jgi:protein SCO1/2
MKNIFLILTIILVILLFVTLRGTDQNSVSSQATTEDLGQDTTAMDKSIGGSFTLTDQNGKTVSDNEFRGRLMLVFFGFTHCPDICPISTATMSKTMELLGPKADSVAPLFISVDPKRDTPDVLKSYLSSFDHHLIGLTGTPDQIAVLVGGYKAFAAPAGAVEEDADKQEAGDTDGDDHDHADHEPYAADAEYSLDHSGFIYLMDKNGNYITHFPYNASPDEIVAAIQNNL